MNARLYSGTIGSHLQYTDSNKRHMFKILTLSSLLTVTSTILIGQSETAKVRALIESSIPGNEKGSITSGTYQSMEEIRYGAVPGLKGVQVRLEQPVCSGQNGALWLVNETGEPWTYKVIDRNGPLVTQGATGYNRKIGDLQPGNYLIQFIHAKGLSVIDNFTVKEGKDLELEITATPQLAEINSNSIKFHVSAPSGFEYEWDFDDGQYAFNENTIIHNFTSPGSYIVKCTVGNFDCNVQKDIEVQISGPASFAEQKD